METPHQTDITNASLWLSGINGELQGLKSRLRSALDVDNTTVTIECRDMIYDVIERCVNYRHTVESKIRSIVSGNVAMVGQLRGSSSRRLVSLLQNRPEDPLIGIERNALETILVMIETVISNTKDWLNKMLPPDMREGYGGGSGDSRDPVPSTPSPKGSFGKALAEPSPLAHVEPNNRVYLEV